MSRPSRLLSLLALPLALPLAVGACVDRTVVQVEPEQETTENLTFTVVRNRNLDLLFVIDDSGSMEREQLQITENFERMIEVLEALPDGLPNIHLGVISTDVGAGQGCTAPAVPPGVLRNQPTVPGCTPPSDRWIADVDDGSGTGARVRNYSGALADSFACIASLGTDGCGFEQPLEAMRRALSPETLANAGFLRDDALLAVVFLTDEDDCSAFDPALFTSDTAVLGPLGNFRCFSQGIDCEGVAPGTLGVRENCVPRDDSPYLTPVDDYVQALRDLKRDDGRIVVAGIMGNPGPIEVIRNDRQQLDLRRTCEIDGNDPQGAFAPLRTDAFLAQFEQQVRTSICEADLSPAIVEIAKLIRDSLLPACVTGVLRDAGAAPGLQADCAVTETLDPGGPTETIATVPACNAADPDAATNPPCWSLVVNEAVCEATPTHLEVVITYPPNLTRAPDTLITVQCATDAPT